LSQPAANAGECRDPFDGLGRGANGAFGERRLDGLGVGGEVARGAVARFAPPESVESAVAIGEDVSLGRGDADVRQAGGIFAGVPEVDGPEDIHLPADDQVVAIAAGADRGLLVGG